MCTYIYLHQNKANRNHKGPKMDILGNNKVCCGAPLANTTATTTDKEFPP